MKRITFRHVLCLVAASLAAPITASAAIYVDSDKANILRQYGAAGTQLVSHPTPTFVGAGASIGGSGGNDGSQVSDQWTGLTTSAHTGTSLFNLPGPRTVGSFKAEFFFYVPQGPAGPSPAFILEGLTNSGWQTLTTVDTFPGTISGTFTPQTVTAVRYTVVGPGTAPAYVVNRELQVFAAAGQTLDYRSGFNILTDTGKVASHTRSTTGNQWRITGQTANVLVDSNYVGNDFLIMGATGTTTAATPVAPTAASLRAFVTYTFNQPTELDMGHLGWWGDQNWDAWEIYTSTALTMPDTQTLANAAPATIQAAGWTLQYARIGFDQTRLFSFAEDGAYRHLMIAFNGSGNTVEFEAFVLPEPGSLSLVGVSALGLLRRRPRGH